MNGRDVFINCPFSADYRDNFQATVFAVVRSGFNPRCARENDEGGEVATWLRDEARDPDVPGGRAIVAEFERFQADLPAIAAARATCGKAVEPAGSNTIASGRVLD